MALLILANFILQSSVLPALEIFGVAPDTALILTVGYGVLRGDVEGAIFGFCCGLAHDLFGGYYIGLFAMLGMLTGFVCGKPFKDFFHDNALLPFIVVPLASVAYQFVLYCAEFLFTGRSSLLLYTGYVIIPKTIYTTAFAIPVYSLLYVINGKLERYEKNRRNIFKDVEP
jgi:rod shape-determining protein MreD